MSWKVYNKNNEELCDIHKLEYSGEYMVGSYVVATIKSPLPIEFSVGDYLIYRGDVFTLNYDPTIIKRATKNAAGDSFVYENIKFNSYWGELERCEFLDYVLNDNEIHFSSLPSFNFHAITINDLANRIKANLDRLYPNDWTINVNLEAVTVSNVIVTADRLNIVGALSLVSSVFKSNFVVRGRTITIGTAGNVIDNVFEYGKGKGLNRITKITDPDQKIITRLRVYGSTRNLPFRYYNKLTMLDLSLYLPNNMAVQNLMLPSFPYETLDPYLESDNIAKYGVMEGSAFFDGSDESLPEIYPSLEGMTASQLSAAGIIVNLDSGDNGNLDEIAADSVNSDGTPITDNGIFEEGATVPSFKITLKDIGFDLNDYLSANTATISMKNGLCGGREFEILSCGKEGNKYVLTCNRIYDDFGLWFPYGAMNIKEGDKFVLLNIEMPDVYIKAASQRLLVAGQEYLSENDDTKYFYEVNVSPVYMARKPELYDTIIEGDYLVVNDDDLNIGEGIVIDQVRIKEGEDIIPSYEIILNKNKKVGTIQSIHDQITSLLNRKAEENHPPYIGANGNWYIWDTTLNPPRYRDTGIKADEAKYKNTTYFAKPTDYIKGDTWFLLEDTVVGGILYKKGTMLKAAYSTGSEYDWRLVFEEDQTTTTDGVNLLRNYDLRYGFSLWGDVGEFGDLTEVEYDALPTEFYTKEINVVGDEYGFNMAITSENNDLIIWNE